jgi:outer membrane protein assembly factor BamE (lipoprotein component of BamABCDE complex)
MVVLLTGMLVMAQEQEPQIRNYERFDDFLSEQKANVDQIKTGMSKEEVMAVMGSSVLVKVPKVGRMKALKYTFKQPEFTNEFHKNTEDQRTIWWYFYEPRDQNGTISKRECNPIIFDKEKVIGTGWEYFNEFRKRGMK